MQRLLALDYGDRYVGVAITDVDARTAVRHSVIDQKKDKVLVVVADLVKKELITRVLVGVPLSLDGEETEQTHVSLLFMEQLRTTLDASVEVDAVDETLTTVEAESVIKQQGAPAQEAHAEAARIILADYLRGESQA